MVSDYALTTRSRVQEYRVANGEELQTTPEINTQIDNFINAVSVRFESYCDRKFVSRTHTEYLDGKGARILYPKQYPITSVTSIHDDMDWVWADSTLISSDNYRIADDNSIVFKSNTTVADARQNIKLVYDAGYSDIPYDLEDACINEVLRILNIFPELGVDEKRSNDYLIKYTKEPFMSETVLVLNKYRRKGAY